MAKYPYEKPVIHFEKRIRKRRIHSETICMGSMTTIIIYGTGRTAETIVFSHSEFNVVGLMDPQKTGETYWGLKVLSKEEVIRSGCKCIVLAARPAVHTIIYNRIRDWTDVHEIKVYDLQGNLITNENKTEEIKSPYFDYSTHDLLKTIEKYDVISFDIFDTLLTRKVYDPNDVFSLLYQISKTEKSRLFFKKRAFCQGNIRSDSNIYDIYRETAKSLGMREDVLNLLQEEIKKENQVLFSRKQMTRCLSACIKSGKKVYLISDMYLTKDILQNILKNFKIEGYEDILISCEYKTTKTEALFTVFRQKQGNEKWIHIGDNHEADYLAAKRNGASAFEVLSPLKMMEISSYRMLLSSIDNVTKRVMIGMLAATLFNDPFALHKSKGMPEVKNVVTFGYVYIGPFAVSLMIWMIDQLKDKGDALILFAARDGWLFQKVYRIFVEGFGLKDMPKDRYLLISRRAIKHANTCKTGDIGRARYLDYINSFSLEQYESVFFFDFMSTGTCQSELQKLIGRTMEGLYVQRSISGDTEKDSVQVKAFFHEKNAFDSDARIFAMCDFLECIFTSTDPSFVGCNESGKPIYEKESRTKKQRKCVQEIQEGALAFCREFVSIMGRLPETQIEPEFCDLILRYTESRYTRIKIPELLDLELDDVTGTRNTGRDVLL